MARAARVAAIAGSLTVALLAVVAAQVRDTAVRPIGTGSIGGVVVSDEATPRPLRRVTVLLSSGDIRMPESAVTDDNGVFLFTALAPGSYSLVATRAGYVQATYGASRPGRGPGVPIAVGDGEHVSNITVKILHGSVITGTVRDQNGQPLVGLQVQVTDLRMVNGERRAGSAIQNVTTDDRGTYRVFGLAPGTYVVLARNLGFAPTSAESREITQDDVRWAQQAVGSASATPGMAPPALPPAPEPGQTVTYASVYYPGTPDASAAGLVVVGPDEERAGVDFSAMPVPTALVSGTIVDPDGQIPQSAQVSLVQAQTDATDLLGAIGGLAGLLGNRGVQNGRFTLSGVTPGRYKVMARGSAAVSGPAPAPTAGAGDLAMLLAVRGGAGPGNLWAMEEITVEGRDVTNLALRLQPGMTVSGRVVFEATTVKPPATFANMRLSLSSLPDAGSQADAMSSMVSAMLGGGSGGTIAADGTFALKGILPDKYRANIMGPGMLGGLASLAAAAGEAAALPPDVWTLKSIVLNGRDVTDVAFEVRPGEDVTGLVITYTDRPTELSGHVLDRAGRPAPGFPIVVFSTDRTQWTPGSRRVRQARPSSDGKFSITGLPAGEYYVCAVTDLEPGDLADPTFLEQLAGTGVKVTLADGEKKAQDLRLAGG